MSALDGAQSPRVERQESKAWLETWVPAFAGTTANKGRRLPPIERKSAAGQAGAWTFRGRLRSGGPTPLEKLKNEPEKSFRINKKVQERT